MTTNPEPDRPLLRMRHLKAWLNVTEDDVKCWIKCGVIHPFYYRAGARAWYLKEEIKAKILRITL
jgi:hypothetical protein